FSRERRPDAHLAVFGELQRVRNEVTQNLRDFSFVRVERRNFAGFFKNEVNRFAGEHWPEDAAQRAEQVFDGELGRMNIRLPGLDLRQVEQITDHLQQPHGALLDKADLLLLLLVQIPVTAIEQ